MTDFLLRSSVYRQASSIFIYISMASEPDTRAIIENAWNAEKAVYVPKCYGQGRMDAIRITDWNGLAPGKLGILEPKDPFRFQMADSVDLCVVPCVAVTRSGLRLGHGAGYYDRWLKGQPSTRAICLCFERMIAQSVPGEPWDVPVDHVLTEEGFFPPL
ncbi:MAG: 5-formyltetrahydrofolate cyclo-ligase, partial [Clostridia bacterium]|nr:5-formyltetrahydrofolate cyclo-ligase [Clostridia bacterium]